MRSVAEALDHLLIGAPSLDDGIAWLEERTGVRAAKGGSHPGLGTWNALASLGPRQYIEIIAPDPGQPGVPTFYIPGLRDFPAPRIATWAARGEQLEGIAGRLPGSLGCDAPRQGSRVRPDGTRLAWTLAFPKDRQHGVYGGALPFLIEWESNEAHPGRSTPSGLGLRAFSIGHPEPAALESALRGLGMDAAVQAADETQLSVELETPRGVVRL